ncbi:MAG TPA: anti-sigma factor antagonist [Acidimicrobiales bacterium]|nr:anti-sigma factor antagonist [Acidimicrobiales bacterium]
MPSGRSNFGVGARREGDDALVAVQGEVDVFTAPEFERALEGAIDGAPASLTVDLADLEFIGSNGLAVIARAASRLARTGGRLTLRSPSAFVLRLLAIAGMSELASGQPTHPRPAALGSEQDYSATDAAMSAGVMDPNRLLRTPALPPVDDVIDGALRLVVALAQVTVGGADGVSVSLQRHGQLATVAASDQTISDMDAIQYDTGEGPCIDASVEGRWFHAESLSSETRWPSFTPRAHALGINAILSSPLRAGDRPIGAINIYSRSVAAFAPEDQRLAAVFAAEASLVLNTAGLDVTDTVRANRFQRALRTRRVIAQAQGVIMERDGVAENEAYAALRRFSLEGGVPLYDCALGIVASTLLTGPDADASHHD